MALARLPFGQTHFLGAMPNYNRLVSGSFRLPCGILFSFLSRYYCAISLETCLGLGVDASRIPTQYPMRSTLVRPKPAMLYIYGAFTLYGSRIPANFDFGESGRKDRPNTTFPRGGSVCPLPFSLAVTKGIAFAFSSSPY